MKYIIFILKKLYKKLFSQRIDSRYTYANAQYEYQVASDIIYTILMNEKPAMIARFGSIELRCCETYQNIFSDKKLIKKICDYITGKEEPYFWSEEIISSMKNNTGFFSSNPEQLELFSKEMIKAMENVDILGSWLDHEKHFFDNLSHAKFVRLPDLEPYFHQDPWTKALENKTVLVIHPFADTIKKQYEKKDLLFSNKNVLPDFKLKTLKAIQSIAGNIPDYDDWFSALESMKKDIKNMDFDIAIIGCGAYGFLLADYVKSIGKKAVHLGGATQLLFGIKGKRWENRPEISCFFNENWVYPDESEYPSNYKKIENGAYW